MMLSMTMNSFSVRSFFIASLLISCHSFLALRVQSFPATRNHQKGISFLTLAGRHEFSVPRGFSVRKTKDPLLFSAASKDDTDGASGVAKAYGFLGAASAVAWVATALIVLSYHPDPKFVNCSAKHNILTISQALAFPLPMLWCTIKSLKSAAKVGWNRLTSATYRRLNLGLAAASMWLAGSAAFPAAFAFGYNLLPLEVRVGASSIHASTALLSMWVWSKSVLKPGPSLPFRVIQGAVGSIFSLLNPKGVSDDPDKQDGGLVLYTLCCVGLCWFSILPVVSPYPLATIPSILGKRLSRPAAAFTFLGAAATYCIKDAAERGRLEASTFKTLRKGLAIGSALHLLLVALKLIGVDDGGLMLPGRGLWEVYPAMVAVPFAAAASFVLHSLLVYAATISTPRAVDV
jgi:hypothetical protein